MEEQRFWLCWVGGTTGGKHHKHPNYERAKQEAQRLAQQWQNRGKRVNVLEMVGYWVAPEVTVEWHEWYDGGTYISPKNVTG